MQRILLWKITWDIDVKAFNSSLILNLYVLLIILQLLLVGIFTILTIETQTIGCFVCRDINIMELGKIIILRRVFGVDMHKLQLSRISRKFAVFINCALLIPNIYYRRLCNFLIIFFILYFYIILLFFLYLYFFLIFNIIIGILLRLFRSLIWLYNVKCYNYILLK